jgi:hypothetical protein
MCLGHGGWSQSKVPAEATTVTHVEGDHYRVNLMLACESSSGDSVS